MLFQLIRINLFVDRAFFRNRSLEKSTLSTNIFNEISPKFFSLMEVSFQADWFFSFQEINLIFARTYI